MFHNNTVLGSLKPLPELSVCILGFCDRLRVVLDEPGEELGTIDFVVRHLLAAKLEGNAALYVPIKYFLSKSTPSSKYFAPTDTRVCPILAANVIVYSHPVFPHDR